VKAQARVVNRQTGTSGEVTRQLREAMREVHYERPPRRGSSTAGACSPALLVTKSGVPDIIAAKLAEPELVAKETLRNDWQSEAGDG